MAEAFADPAPASHTTITNKQNATLMPDNTASLTRRNLRDLVWIRAITILGQVLAITIGTTVFDIELPLLPLALVIAVQIGWNLFASWLLHHFRQLSDRAFFVHMLPDVLTLSAMLYLTGGAGNPFSWVYLLPLSITASVLERRYAWAMGVLTVLCYSLLMFWYLPLRGEHGMQHGASFQLHILGMWAGFVLSAGLIAYFISDMATSLREREQRLARAREKALRDERLVALGTLATGAAHELGTPLGTMALLSGEMQQQYRDSEHQDLRADLQLMDEQIRRCKQALSVISASSGVVSAVAGRILAVGEWLPAVIERWQRLRPDARLEYRMDESTGTDQLLADDTVNQALTTVLDNAADACPQPIELTASSNRKYLLIEVSDRGPGLDAHGNAKIGRHPFTTKSEGLGLGLFLAHATLERIGGRVQLLPRPGGGTCTRLELPLTEGTANE